MTTARILIVAGSDSGGGAGIQADIKTVTMLGGHAMTAVTAITAQNTLGVDAVLPIPPDMVVAQMRAVIDDIGVDAVKIGMIGSAETAHAVAEMLEALTPSPPRGEGRGEGPGSHRDRTLCETPSPLPTLSPSGRGLSSFSSASAAPIPIVFDPVMIATSGAVLADAATITAFERLLRIATLVTPNLPEAAALGGVEAIAAHGPAILLKGGHADGPSVTDTLHYPDGRTEAWNGPRIETPHTHGTGCTLASGIAEGLGRGLTLSAAIERARTFVRLALHAAPGLGQGNGPLGPATVRLDCMVDATPNQITLSATDYRASVDFYRALGLTPIVASGDRYARFESAGGTTLSIEAADEIGGRPIVFLEVADLDAAVVAVRAHGVAVAEPIQQPWGWREARLADPAGNPLCLYAAGENRRYPAWRLACPD